MSCYVRSTSGGKVRLSLDGTTADTSGLSATTWNLVTVADASSSGVSISAQVLVGNATGDTGDVIVGGCQVEAGTYATSYMITAGASVQRLTELGYLSMGSASSVASVAASVVTAGATFSNARVVRVDSSGSDANRFELFIDANKPSSYVAVSSSGQQVLSPTAPTLPGSFRFSGWQYASTTQHAKYDATETSAATVLGALPALNRVYVGAYISAGFEPNGVVSRVCVDPSPTRCR
jgi:hypothetical protein